MRAMGPDMTFLNTWLFTDEVSGRVNTLHVIVRSAENLMSLWPWLGKSKRGRLCGVTRVLRLFLVPRLQYQITFQQDGATLYWSVLVLYFHNDTVKQNWCGCRSTIDGLPYPRDLTLSDFFFWGCMKNTACAEGLQDIEMTWRQRLPQLSRKSHLRYWPSVMNSRVRRGRGGCWGLTHLVSISRLCRWSAINIEL